MTICIPLYVEGQAPKDSDDRVSHLGIFRKSSFDMNKKYEPICRKLQIVTTERPLLVQRTSRLREWRKFEKAKFSNFDAPDRDLVLENGYTELNGHIPFDSSSMAFILPIYIPFENFTLFEKNGSIL